MRAFASLLAADSHYFFHLRNPLRNVSSQELLQTSLIVVAMALATAAGWWLIVQIIRLQRRRRSSPGGLFRSLCAAHALSYQERSLLKLLAARHALTQPAILFVEPRLWEATELGAELLPYTAQLRSLRERLFARN